MHPRNSRFDFFIPSSETFILVPAIHCFCNVVPAFAVPHWHCNGKLLIFLQSPLALWGTLAARVMHSLPSVKTLDEWSPSSALSIHSLCDFWPVFSIFLYSFRELVVIRLCPVILWKFCSQRYFPPLKTLLICASIYVLSDFLPIATAKLDHCDGELLVFLAGPRPLDEVRFEDFVPSLKALFIRTAFHNFSNLLPVAFVFPDSF